MNKKLVLSVLVVSIFITVSAYAKQKNQWEDALSADQIVAKMKMQLGLTDQQLVEVKAIVDNYWVQEKQLQLEEKMQLSKILTDQQLYTWNFLQSKAPPRKKKQSLF